MESNDSIEQWRPIAGYEGLYEVSNKGNVRGVEKKVRGTGKKCTRTVPARMKKKSILKIGYEIVLLHKEGKYKTTYVHRIVANAFIPNPDNKPMVNHLDGDKANNNVSNLEWCDQARNIQHAYEMKLIPCEKPIRCVETGKIYRSETAASMELFGDKRAQSFLGEVCRGEKARAYGFHWEFV